MLHTKIEVRLTSYKEQQLGIRVTQALSMQWKFLNQGRPGFIHAVEAVTRDKREVGPTTSFFFL